MTLLQLVGKWCRHERMKLGLSQTQLGNKTGYSEVTIIRFERANGGCRMTLLFDLMTFFKCDFQDINDFIKQQGVKNERSNSAQVTFSTVLSQRD